jgi:high-affinity iron transporter
MKIGRYPAFVIMLLALVGAFAPPCAAAVPWQDAEALRSETAATQRLLFRAPDDLARRDMSARIERVRHLWPGRLQAAYRLGAADAVAPIDAAVDDFAAALSGWNAAAAAAARARLWTALLDGAFDATLTALDEGRSEDASQWLNIREYARTSRDTAATIAMREVLARRLEPAKAREVIEAELLGVYAGELRRSIAESRSHLASGYPVQFAHALARARGLRDLLSDNIAARIGHQQAEAIKAALAEAGARPSGSADPVLARLETSLATYSPTSLSPEDRERRVRLLSRFIGLIPVEYEKGVRDGAVTIPFEYFEAGLFRDRAAMLFGDLGADLAAGSPQAFERLGAILAEMETVIDAKGDEKRVRALSGAATKAIADTYGLSNEGGYRLALGMLPDLFDEILLVAEPGDWEEAELKRLEAYALFDPDIEQRLMPRAPALALKMEAGFWEGSASEAGLGRLIADKGPQEALRQVVERMKAATAQAHTILDRQLSSLGAFLQSLAILVREGLEAVLVLACMIGALKAGGTPAGGLRGWRLPVSGGVSAALLASFALWLAVGELFDMSTLQRELLEGATALLAAGVLLYVTHWMFRKAYVGDWVAHIRRKAEMASGAGGAATMFGGLTVFGLAFLVVFREGFETVLFYEALLADAPAMPVLGGLVAGSFLAVAVAYLMLGLEARLPVKAFFRVTGALLALMSVTLVGSGIRGLQTAAVLPATPVSWFPDQTWLQLYLGLYPVAEALLAQFVIALLLLGSIIGLLAVRSRAASATPRSVN